MTVKLSGNRAALQESVRVNCGPDWCLCLG